MALDLEWDRPLRHRKGAPQRLCDVDVYYDFEWGTYFSDGRAQFKNGQCLAENICARCPEEKDPALLLTDDEDADQGYRETAEHLVFVLNLPRYLETYADPSLAYQAYQLGDGITRLGPLNEQAADRARAGAAVIDANLDIAQIVAWATDSPERQQQLREIAGGAIDPREADIHEVLAALEALSNELDADAVATVGKLFGADADPQRRLELLRAITADPNGRYLTGEVMLERVPQRIAEAREAMADYEALLEDEQTTETRMQAFIEDNLWLLGLEYVKARARHDIPRGTADFILERIDGFHDLLELKDPKDPIITAPDEEDGTPPPAHDYQLSRGLANALAQAHVYRDTMTTDAQTVERLFGLPHARDPRLIVVIGLAESLPEHRLRVLRELNKSLHHVEVVPYDVLAKRAAKVLDNIEEHLSVAAEQAEAG